MPTDRRPSHVRRLGVAAATALVVAAAIGRDRRGGRHRRRGDDETREQRRHHTRLHTLERDRFCTELPRRGHRRRGRRPARERRARLPAPHDARVGRPRDGVRRGSGEPASSPTSPTWRSRPTSRRSATGNDQAAPSINIPINPNKAGSTFTTLVWEPTYTGARGARRASGSGGRPRRARAAGGPPARSRRPAQPNKYGFPSYSATFAQVKAALPDAIGLRGRGEPGQREHWAHRGRRPAEGQRHDLRLREPAPDGRPRRGDHGARNGEAGLDRHRRRSPLTNAGRSPARDVSTALIVGAACGRARQGGFGIGGVATFRTPTLAVGALA